MSFTDIVRRVAEQRKIPLPPAKHPEALAAIPYADELSLKEEALGLFWKLERLPGRPGPIVPAPAPRAYRTTSKRRASFGAKGLVFSFPGSQHHVRGLAPSTLDLPEHLAVYAYLLERIGRPPARFLASALNWVVVRGTPGSLVVILNVSRFDARVVRGAKLIAEELQAVALGVRSGFLYLDPTNSDYYLEAQRPEEKMSMKRLFGPERMEVTVAGARLRFPATVFSQVNGAMLEEMTRQVGTLLGPLNGFGLLDLYCGYGLFSLTVGRGADRVVGVDSSTEAIESARGSASRLECTERMRFLVGRIDGRFLARRLRPSLLPEVVLLDPPRQGTAPEVVRTLAERRPARVVHLCCGTDEIPREVKSWTEAGYRMRQAVPLDLFAGTIGLETLLLLEPA